ncbi:9866_t:CDS:2 [Scutellospora calospora]|uniref:9866_t:CDS:1 n=1 Tax=Scutellospora calospora TaxID=85575 RepID=A0ACA9K096_9GLOM|nr:9866_t:CDS:2 [Scutellospora calospora]
MSKSIIVTGASRGIGRATTLQLLKLNSNVTAVARSSEDLKNLKTHVENVLGVKGRLETVTGDITEEPVVEEVVKRCVERWGGIDGIIANAGSKAALHMLIKCIAVEEPDIISVSILPGVVDTDMQVNIRENGLKAEMKQTDYQNYINRYESKTLVHPDDPSRVMAALVVGGATREMSGESFRFNDPKFAHLLKKE